MFHHKRLLFFYGIVLLVVLAVMAGLCACATQDGTPVSDNTDNTVESEVGVPANSPTTVAETEAVRVTAMDNEKKEERINPSKEPKDVDGIAADLSSSVSFFMEQVSTRLILLKS